MPCSRMLRGRSGKAITAPPNSPTSRATGTQPMAAQARSSYQLTVMSGRILRRIAAAAGALAFVGSHELLPPGLVKAQAGQLSAANAQALTQGTVVERTPG